MIWIALVLMGTIFYSFTTLLQRAFLKEEESSSFAYAIFFQFSVAVLVLVYTLIVGFRLPPIKPLIPSLILMGILYSVANAILYKGLKITDASKTSILSSSKSIWTMLAAVIFLGEPIKPLRILGMILVILGVVVISLKRDGKKLNKGHILILISAMMYGFAFVNSAFLLKSFEAPIYSVISFGLPAIMLFLVRPKSIKEMKFFFDKKHILKVLVVSILYAVASIAVYLAYQTGGDASQIMPIVQCSSILIVILGYFFLKERDMMLRKGIGLISALAGIILLIS